MERKNVDQRFPHKGDNPGRGKPGTEDSGQNRHGSYESRNRSYKPDKPPKEDSTHKRKQLTRRPRIIKKGDMEDTGTKRPWLSDRDRPSYPQRTDRYPSSPPAQRQYDSNRDGDSGRTRPAGNSDRGPYRGRDQYPYDDQSKPRRFGGYNDRSQRNFKRPGKPRPLGPGEMYAPPPHPEVIMINRYIANSGICSRRDADKLVEAGEISVN